MISLSICSFLVTVVLIPFIIKICDRYKIYDKIDKRKIHVGNISRLGGLAVVVSFFLVIILNNLIFNTTTNKFSISLIVGGLIIFIMGVLDDFCSLKAKYKLLLQCIAAFIVVANGYRFKQLFGFSMPSALGSIISFLWIVGIINSYNLIDGLDGLCGGLGFLTLGALGIIFARSAIPAATICFILCGSIAGFLIFNKPPAKIFLGDSGSQFLGFAVASLPLYYSSYNYEYNKFLIMITLVSIPMTDTIAAIWRRTREHRSFFSPDKHHIHHKLINIGFSKKATLLFLMGLQFLICLSVGLAMYLQSFNGTILLVISCCFIFLFFSVLHYINRAINKRNLEYFKENNIQ